MKYLFWNTGKKNINPYLAELIMQEACDVVGLAEYTDNLSALLRILSNMGGQYYHVDKIGCDRIDIITKYTPGYIDHCGETSYYTIKKIPHDTLGFHLVAFVHFPSKLYAGEKEYIVESMKLKNSIEEAEVSANLDKTIIVGDFNMNPFESGMVLAASLHSIACRKEVHRRQTRQVNGKRYSMFYNPTWNLLGDIHQPAGTYYYDKGGQETFYWNVFDQVILRHALVERFVPDSLRILTRTSNLRLIDEHGYPTISDHLPIFFEIQ